MCQALCPEDCRPYFPSSLALLFVTHVDSQSIVNTNPIPWRVDTNSLYHSCAFLDVKVLPIPLFIFYMHDYRDLRQ